MKKNTALFWIRDTLRGRWLRIVLQIFLKCLSVACGAFMALFLRDVIDIATQKQLSLLYQKLFMLVGLVALQYTLAYLSSRMQATINIFVSTGIRQRTMRKLFMRSYAEIEDFHSGELMNRLTTDAETVANVATALLPEVVSMSLQILFVGILLGTMSWRLLVIASAVGVATGIGSLLMRPITKRMQRDVRTKEGKVRGFMQETLLNLPVIKAFAAADVFAGQLAAVQDESIRSRMRQRRLSSLTHTLVGFGFSASYLVSLGWCAVQLVTNPMFSYGTLTAILQLVSQIRSPIAGMGNVVPNYYTMLVSAERLMELEALTAEEEHSEDMSDLAELRAEGLSFGYREDEPVLADVNMTVQRGALVALTGRSGIGKSTLMKLLLALYQPDCGTLTLRRQDGTERPLSAATRTAFAYVPQGNMLFSGTVRQNVALFCEEVSEEKVWEALRVACADDFVREMPEGLDTPLREDGQGVSEGQAQRIAVARALVTLAPMLLLDEATSALDEKTELTLLHNIRETGRTCLIISHRPRVMEVATAVVELG